MLVKGVDAIILDEMDSEWCSTIVEKCKEDGVPFVECNTLTSNTDYTCYVGSDDVDSGLIQAKFLKTVLPDDAKICILYGPLGQSPQILRRGGYLKGGVMGGIYKVLQEKTANWKREEALSLSEDWLTRYPDLEAIVSEDDDRALGALAAVEAAGKKGKINIVGIDVITDGL